nr:olfactory receptor 55 [Tropidothorax elegans]
MESTDAGSDNDTFYDFRNKNNLLLILGSYKLVDVSLFLKRLNIIFSVVVQALLFSSLAMSLLTVAKSLQEKAVMGQALFTLGTVLCAIIYIADNYFNRADLDEAAKSLREGIFRYDDPLEQDYAKLRRSRVKHLETLVNVLSMLYMSSVFVYVVFFPLINFLLLAVDTDNLTVNVYLPLQVYYPFDTRTPWVFGLTFTANGLTLLSMYATFSCYVQVFISSCLQLTGEYEVLNFSIENVSERALRELANYNIKNYDIIKSSKIYDSLEYKKCMVHCLKQNIRHHHAILRFKKKMNTYLEVGAATAVLVVSGLMAAALVIVLEDPKRYIILTLTLIATVLTYYPGCWIGELLSTTSSKTADALFYTPWPNCDDEFKTNLRIFIQNTLHPCILQTFGLRIKVSLETFAEVMSAGYKLINFIR